MYNDEDYDLDEYEDDDYDPYDDDGDDDGDYDDNGVEKKDSSSSKRSNSVIDNAKNRIKDKTKDKVKNSVSNKLKGKTGKVSNSVKTGKNVAKGAKNTANTAKTAAKAGKTTAKAAKTAMQAMRLILHAIQAAIHATIALVQALIAAIAAAWPIVLAIIVILVLILAIFALVNFFSSNFKDMSMTWGYLWSGTSAYVDEDQVSNLYYQLTKNGISFEEIGAYGEHNFINEKYLSKANYILIGSSQVDDPAKLDKYGDSFLEDSIRLDDNKNIISLHKYVENLLNQSINEKITYNGATMPIFSVPLSVSGVISTYDVSDDFRAYTKVRDSYSLLYYMALAAKYNDLLKPVQADKSAQDFVENFDINDYDMTTTTEVNNIYPEEIEKVDQLGPDGKVLYEKPQQAGARLYSEALLSFTNNKFDDENSPYNGLNKINPLEGAGLYLNRYLMAEKETYTIRNDMTFAGIGYRGAIYITNGNEYIANASILSKLYQSALGLPLVNNVIGYAIDEAKLKYTALKVITNWDTGDQSLAAEDDGSGTMRFKINWQNDITVPFKNGSVFSDENAANIYNNNSSSLYNFKIETKSTKLDITDWVKAYAMPWQYPFAFHVATLSPDVGYEIALLAHKYHDLQLNVRNVAKGSKIVVDPLNKTVLLSDQNIIEPEVFLKYIATWYESTTRSYVDSSFTTLQSRSSGWHEAPQGKKYTKDELIALGIKEEDYTPDMLKWVWGKATNYDEVHNEIGTIEAPTYTTNDGNNVDTDVTYTFNIPDNKALKDVDGFENEEMFVIVKKTETRTTDGYSKLDCGSRLSPSVNTSITYETKDLEETMTFDSYKPEMHSHLPHYYCGHECDEDCKENGCTHTCDGDCAFCGGTNYYVYYTYSYEFEYRNVYDFTYEYEDNYIETVNDDPVSKQVIYLTEAEKTELESQGVEVKTNSTAIKDSEKYYRVLELGGRTAMKQILFPDVEMTSDGIINESTAVKYYRANSFFEKDYLNITSSAETILKSLYDLYSQTDYTTSPEEVESLVDEYNKMGSDEVSQIESSDMINGIPNYLCLEGNHIPVIQLIELFVEQGVLSDEQIGRTASTTDFALGAQWVVDDNSFVTSSINGVVTIQCGEGKDVFAPYDGEVKTEIIDGVNYVTITSDVFGTTYLSNVNVAKTGSVKKGNVIGVSTGDMNYYRTESSVDGISEVADLKDELDDLREKYYSTYTWPVPSSGSISSPFGSRKDPVTGEISMHHGMDIAASNGASIVSYADGTIESVLNSPVYGKYIVVKHSDKMYTLYAHMSSFGVYGVGSNVKKGDVIGYVGSTGKSTGPHLHFEVRVGENSLDKAINPTYKLGNYITY